MSSSPDYVTWASLETLSPHAIACLMLGVEPTCWAPGVARDGGVPPSIPYDALDLIDQDDWRKGYERIYRCLRVAVESSVLAVKANGEPSICNAMDYLQHVAETNMWLEQITDAEFFRVIRGRLPSRVSILEQQLVELKEALDAKPGASSAAEGERYINSDLKWLFSALDEFQDDYLGDKPPGTEFVSKWIVDQSARLGEKVSNTMAMRIARVLTPNERKAGGRKLTRSDPYLPE